MTQPPRSFPPSEFDEWAETYDTSVGSDEFPFYGYQKVLDKIVEEAQAQGGMAVLDLGTGTGNLAARFNPMGCDLWCTDFSKVMLSKARQKLPHAHFYRQDLRGEWPSRMRERFDRIVSAYVFHHFEQDEKVRIIDKLIQDHLAGNGRLVIADIAFRDRQALEDLKRRLGDQWEEEYFWVADEALQAFDIQGGKVKYQQVSVCAGVFTFEA